MLSAYGAEVVAYQGDGFIVHPHCAVERYGELTVAKAERGLTNTANIDPRNRYSLESEYDPEGVSCDHCGLWIIEPEPQPYYQHPHPDERYGTVFDPEDDTFGPILAALQAGDFETARDLTAELVAREGQPA